MMSPNKRPNFKKRTAWNDDRTNVYHYQIQNPAHSSPQCIAGTSRKLFVGFNMHFRHRMQFMGAVVNIECASGTPVRFPFSNYWSYRLRKAAQQATLSDSSTFKFETRSSSNLNLVAYASPTHPTTFKDCFVSLHNHIMIYLPANSHMLLRKPTNFSGKCKRHTQPTMQSFMSAWRIIDQGLCLPVTRASIYLPKWSLKI